MRRYLVVANQTMGGEKLHKAIRERINYGPCEFHVLVPETPVEHYAAGWSTADPVFGVDARARAVEEQVEQAHAHTRQRLERLLDDIREQGVVAVSGHIGDPDPVAAIEQAVGQRDFDEVILSTLPAGVSRWLGMDLPSRAARKVTVRVTTVIAD